MSLALMTRKLYLDEKRFIESDRIRDYCKKLNMDYYVAVRYLLHQRYLIRILKGVFYIPSVEERKFDKINISYLDAISEALKIKKVGNWYFGLETALKLNKLTHEYFAVDYVINDKIFRHNTILVLSHKIKFVKLKISLFDFGIRKDGMVRFSDVEKTILDIVYLSRYNGLSDDEIKNKVLDLLKNCSKRKLLGYAKKYNNPTYSFMRRLL
ncbi:hypothetical protein COT48_00635 [Candidatus Woesearchaeota archaeon CG08_land_8_20_14_0_20_47_9]|nr:MAG: hypothetical protein COT48_00635 [Candidatus Woesearchaeota archaeon CG08_land_8_20_14_0_20_47_9]